MYLHDLRSCRNPQHDVSHRGHVGYYPGIWSQLGHLPSFRSELLNALRECSNERCCTIAFQCTAGRHRSVAAAMLLERLIWVRFPLCNVEVLHLHEDRWAESTCRASCNSCWITGNRAPNEQLRVLIQNLLEEFDGEAYMCAALQRVSPEGCPSNNTCTRLNMNCHVSSDHADCKSHKSCCPNLQKLHCGMEGYVDWQLFQAISLFLCIMKMILAPFMKEVLLLIIVRHMIGLGPNIIAPRFPNFLQGLPLQKPLPTQSLTLSPQGLPSHRHGRRGPHNKNHSRKGRENAASVTLMALTALSKNTAWSKIFGTKFTIHSIHLHTVTACSVPTTAKLPVLPQVRCPEAVTRRQGPWTYDALELEILMNGLIASLIFLTINSTLPCSGIAKMLLVCTFREVTKVKLAAFFVSCKCRDPTQVGNMMNILVRDSTLLPHLR